MACVFCDIVSGKLAAAVVTQNEATVAFLDKAPLFRGHVLVVPRRHVATLDELDTDSIVQIFSTVQRVMRAITTGLGAQGTFVANNNVVSQSVPHLHVHVVPRTKGDGLKGFFWPRHKYASDEEMSATAEKLSAALPPP